jgi:hypothetical protein
MDESVAFAKNTQSSNQVNCRNLTRIPATELTALTTDCCCLPQSVQPNDELK